MHRPRQPTPSVDVVRARASPRAEPAGRSRRDADAGAGVRTERPTLPAARARRRSRLRRLPERASRIRAGARTGIALALRTQREPSAHGVEVSARAARRCTRRGWSALDVSADGKDSRARDRHENGRRRNRRSTPTREESSPPAATPVSATPETHHRTRLAPRRRPPAAPAVASAPTPARGVSTSETKLKTPPSHRPRGENRQDPVRDQAMGGNPDRRQEARCESADQRAFGSGRPSSNRNPEQYVFGLRERSRHQGRTQRSDRSFVQVAVVARPRRRLRGANDPRDTGTTRAPSRVPGIERMRIAIALAAISLRRAGGMPKPGACRSNPHRRNKCRSPSRAAASRRTRAAPPAPTPGERALAEGIALVRRRRFQRRDQATARREGNLDRLDDARSHRQQSGRAQVRCVQLLRDKTPHALPAAVRRRA